jgi:hypothetical protein
MSELETKENEIQPLLIDDLISKWNSLSKDEKYILGKPNFTCGRIAHRMKDLGFDVIPQAENEQALVIFCMLEFYKVYGKDWTDKMNVFLKNNNS